MVLATMIVPAAFAATKIVDNTTDVDQTFANFPGWCGGDEFNSTINRVGRSHFTRWDNGHTKFSAKLSIKITDNGSGAVIGTGHQTFNSERGEGGLPRISQNNVVIKCSDGSRVNFHNGNTVDENGNFHPHG